MVLLHHHGVATLVDVRTIPASRRMPHFSKQVLARALPERGIAYRHMPELGGLRKPKPDSINTGWRNVSFRGYADYMQTAEFVTGLEGLLALPTRRLATPTSPAGDEMKAVMCAEAVPWRCHRSLIADALTARGVEVRHITGMSEAAAHKLTPFAQVDGGRITYPAPDTLPI